MLAKKDKKYIQMNKQKEADKSSVFFLHPFVQRQRETTCLLQARQESA